VRASPDADLASLGRQPVTAPAAAAETAAAPEPAAPTDAIGDPLVSRALVLGWQMARLHRTAVRMGTTGVSSEGKLPGLSRLSGGQRTEIGIAEVHAGLHLLAPRFVAAGLPTPSADAVNEAFHGPSSDELKKEVYCLHICILGRLSAADATLGKAYGLGRALSDTCAVETRAEAIEEFADGRAMQLREWLQDLESALPPHSARAVHLSMGRWVAWADASAGPPAAGDAAKQQDDATQRALERQGRLWLALLSAQKSGTDMLEVSNYIAAADRLVTHAKSIVASLLKRYGGSVAGAVVVFLVGVVIALASDEGGHVVAGIGVAAAALGVTWKGIGSQLGGLADDLRRPLWGAELDEAIAEAIDEVPQPVG
jgi:hypothetical protein